MSDGIWSGMSALASVVLFGAALQDGLMVRRLRRHGVRTQGLVVDNVRVDDSDGHSWAPVIEFTDHQGYRVQFSPRARGTGLGLPTGRRVDVLYLAENPQTARVFQRRHMSGIVWSLTAGGTVFAAVAVWIALT
ncbi:DUF3592 domain-containing protein [Streptomyces sp. NPDC050848]|uniref:DUF3592 domain-containing protein n=1 Tax=Streptomyces sp. NPDC050848 TaxID=3155791 RepID=UPI0033D2EFDC